MLLPAFKKLRLHAFLLQKYRGSEPGRSRPNDAYTQPVHYAVAVQSLHPFHRIAFITSQVGLDLIIRISDHLVKKLNVDCLLACCVAHGPELPMSELGHLDHKRG